MITKSILLIKQSVIKETVMLTYNQHTVDYKCALTILQTPSRGGDELITTCNVTERQHKQRKLK